MKISMPQFWISEVDFPEIDKRADDAFDKEFFDTLSNEDDLGVVVRSHLHIEYKLKKFLEELIPHPDGLNIGSLANLRYEQLVDLSIAFGIRPNIVSPIKKLGQLRNRFSHELRGNLSKSEIMEFRGTFDSDSLDRLEDLYQSTKSTLSEKPPQNIINLPEKELFIIHMVGLYRDLVWFIEAVKFAKLKK